MKSVFVRRAEFDDHRSILALIGEEAHLIHKRYGAFDVTSMIEHASLGVSAVDDNGMLIGYSAFFDFPALISAVSPSSWPDWLHTHFGHEEYTPSNSVFLSFFISDHLCENETLAAKTFPTCQGAMGVQEAAVAQTLSEDRVGVKHRGARHCWVSL